MTLQPGTHFRWQVAGKVATITLDRPEKKNPLTFSPMPNCAIRSVRWRSIRPSRR